MRQGAERKEEVGLKINAAECLEGWIFSCPLIQMLFIETSSFKQDT